MSPPTALITGFPKTELACWVLHEWLSRDPSTRAICVVPERFLDEAETRLTTELPGSERERVRLLEGDAAHMDMGLTGSTLKQITSELTVIHHCAAMSYSGVEPRRALEFNSQAAREAVELALISPRLERLVHWSTTRAVGSVGRRVSEDSTAPPRRGPIAESRYLAECILREAHEDLPITILRTPNLVGDSRTGRWPRMEGVYLIARSLHASSREVALPVPARRDGVLNLVPVDFAAQAGLCIAAHPASVGRTFHIVDPDPPTVAEVLRLLAELTGRPEPVQGIPGPVAEAILNAPGISRLAHGPRDLLDDLGRRVTYDDENAREILDAADLHCPALAEYAARIVAYARTAPGGHPADEEARSVPLG